MIQLYINTKQTVSTTLTGDILANTNFANPIVSTYNSEVLKPSYTTSPNGATYGQGDFLYDIFENNLPVPGDWKAFTIEAANNTVTMPVTVTNGEVIFQPPNTAAYYTSGIYQLVFCEPSTTYELTYDVTKNDLLGGAGSFSAIRGLMLNGPYQHNSTVNSNFLGNVSGFAEDGISQSIPLGVGSHTVTINQTMNFQTYGVFYLHISAAAGVVGEELKITNIKLRKQGSGTIDIEDEEYEQLDLYKDENIPLVFNVDNFTKASEKIANYSKNFTVPASKHNNGVFRHVFDVTVNSDFNVHRRTKAYITQNTQLVFEGYLRLLSIKKKGDEYVYEVNMFDNTISLKDTLKGKTIEDIDFKELNHQYRIGEIQQTRGTTSATPGQMALDNPLQTGTFAGTVGNSQTSVIQYPLCDWTGQITYSSGVVGAGGRLENMYRPWIKCNYIWNRIIDEAGFTWSSRYSFKTDDYWTKLYMDMNWGSGNDIGVGNYFNAVIVKQTANSGLPSFQFTVNGASTYGANQFADGKAFNLTQGSFVKIPLNQESPASSGWNGSTYIYTAPADITVDVSYSFYIFGFDLDVCDFRVVHTSSVATFSSPFLQTTVNMPNSNTIGAKHCEKITGSFQIPLAAGETFHFELKNGGSDDCFLMESLTTGLGFFNDFNTIEITENAVGTNISTIMLRNRGKIKQWEFIKSFIDRFNLVVELDKDDKNHLYFDYYYEWESSGQTHNWTNKVDEKDMDIKPVTSLKDSILFHDTLDDDFHNQAYHTQLGEINGQATFTDPDNNLAEGEEKIKTFFSPNIIAKGSELSAFNNCIWTHAYKVNEDGTTTDFDSKPRLGYRNLITTSASVTVPAQNGQTSNTTTSVLTMRPFFHDNSLDINWGHAFSYFGAYTSPTDNVVSKFWLQYLRNLYNKNTRIITVKIYLTEVDMHNFNFSDIVMIKNREYRVNKIEYNAENLSKVELILLP